MLEGLFNKQQVDYSQDTKDILQLIRSENVGIKTFQTLLNIYGSAKIALENIDDLARRGGRAKPITIYSKQNVEQEIAKLNKIGARLISFKDEYYPPLLKQIADYPPIITVLGKAELLLKPIVAIVGSRNASANGTIFTNKVAQALGNRQYIVASGLARGIDTAAHNASINTGTVAVIAGGIDHIYPVENTKLYHDIAHQGVIISELAIGTVPRAQNFPQRNRIISGLSIATVVIEANLKSGSLITAREALEQNREIFAMPGFPLDPRAQGTNRLIKQGANLIESIDDLLDNLPAQYNIKNIVQESINDYSTHKHIYMDEQILNIARTKILTLLSAYPTEIDLLAKQAAVELPQLHVILIELELAGKLDRHPGNKVSLKYE